MKNQSQQLFACYVFSGKAAAAPHIWDHIYERRDVGGHNWKTSQNHGMRRLCWSKGTADRCFAAMVHWTESNTAQKNGKASIYLSLWNGQHGLFMLMKLALKELSDSCTHTLLPSKGSSFGSKREKKETEISVRVKMLPFLYPVPGSCPTYYPNHTKSNKVRMSVSKHSLDWKGAWIIPRWIVF